MLSSLNSGLLPHCIMYSGYFTLPPLTCRLMHPVYPINQFSLCLRRITARCLAKKTINNKQQTTNSKQQTTNKNNKQKTTNNKQKQQTTNKQKQQTKNNKQQTKNNKQQTTNNKQQTECITTLNHGLGISQ